MKKTPLQLRAIEIKAKERLTEQAKADHLKQMTSALKKEMLEAFELTFADLLPLISESGINKYRVELMHNSPTSPELMHNSPTSPGFVVFTKQKQEVSLYIEFNLSYTENTRFQCKTKLNGM